MQFATDSEVPRHSGDALPKLITAVPGPQSEALVDTLAAHECPAITARRARRAASIPAPADENRRDPIVWEQAVGTNIIDVDGNVYVDLTSGFGVAFVGHRHPAVVAAARAQQERLLHAMGDVYPDRTRIALLDQLARITPGDLEVSILGLSGSDAVDGAVKTAVLATGRTGVLTFDRSYHGLSLGTVALQGYKAAFREPFAAITHPDVRRLPFGCPLDDVETALATGEVGLVLVEPVLGRGGMVPAPDGWLAGLQTLARRHGALFGLDEIQSGMGRTGDWFAGMHDGLEPDLLCVGKALAGGFPLSATVGTRSVMDAWGESKGEALHTQTFLGHPVGCAAALAVIDLIEREDLLGQARAVSETLSGALTNRGFTVHGRGLMLAVHVDNAIAAMSDLLQRGFVVLPAGPDGTLLGLTPPVALTEPQIEAFSDALVEVT